MASSDDEAEGLPQCVSNYHFVDDYEEPISFSVLPIQWREGESPDRNQEQIFLRGTVDNGLQKVYKHVIAWRFDLSNVNPEISVLSKENNWIKLQKPRKSFEDTIRTILITVQCLHFLKKYPETSEKSLWDHLSKVFSSYEVIPSQNDLVDHIPLISEAVKRDDSLEKSKFLCIFLEEKPGKRKLFDEAVKTISKSGFIVDEMDDDILDEEEDESNEKDVCEFCDNGGELVCCDGKCMRFFHGTVEAGADSQCVSLGFSHKEEVDAIQNFICKNCEYKQHQCFACGKLGSSDKFSSAEVFQCVSATCGYFYHPRCVARLLHQENEVSIEELEKKIAAGESFTCPIHKCCVCKKGENNKDPQLQFAVCRRCPKSYHRKCLPREIAFEDIEDEYIRQRAWEGLLNYNRILIYCLKHEIDEELKTPIRDHINFPGVKTPVEKKKSTLEEKKKRASGSIGNKEKDLSNKKNLALDDSYQRKIAVNVADRNQKTSSLVKTTKSEKMLCPSEISRKVKANGASRYRKSISLDSDWSTGDGNKPTLGNRLYGLMKGNGQVKSMKQDTPDGEVKRSLEDKAATNTLGGALPPLDADTEERLLDLMKDAASSITLEAVKNKRPLPCTHTYSSKNNVDKSITMGKLEGSVEAVRAALRKLEEGCSCEDAEAVCGPEVLDLIFKWKQKLQVYLAPFLFGNRYTSFGRHFTKVEKLEEIVDKLHWYAQNGDMIVDFCCGANDFSILMKKKLEETGKKCSYKNYDIVQPKNDFNYEKRDWMTVKRKELLTGSQLIMGLNPPFGVRASLANRFIDKALEFNPKLLILIVPPETQRLDEKKTPYDLVWEDDQSLSGKSFYLPGSVDENDKQMDDWNLKPPPLSLWSHRDWTAKHKAIAEKQGHLLKQPGESEVEKNHPENIIHIYPTDNRDHYGDTHDLPTESDRPEKFRGGVVVTESHFESSPCSNSDRGSIESKGQEKNRHDETRKRKHDEEKLVMGMCEISPKKNMAGGRSHCPPPNVVHGQSLLESRQSKSRKIPSHAETGKNQPNKRSVRKRNRDEQPNAVDGSSSLEGPQSKSREMPSHGKIGKNQPNEASVSKRNHDKEKHRIGIGGISPKNKLDCRSPRSPPNVVNRPSSLEGKQSKPREMPSHAEIGKNQPSKTSIRKRNRGKGKNRRGMDEISREKSSKMEKISPENKMDGGRHRRSPPNVVDGRSSLEGPQSKSRKMPSPAETGDNVHHHFEPSLYDSRMQFAAAYGGSQASMYDEMNRRYNRSSKEPYSSGTQRLLTRVSPGSNYRARDMEEQLTSRMRDDPDSLSYRPYITRVEEKLTRDIDRRSHVRLYEQHDPDLPRCNYLGGHDPWYDRMGSMPSTYGRPALATDLSDRMNTSAMQRYAPQLDELNHARPVNTYRSESSLLNRYGFNSPRAPQPGFQGSPMGFAPDRHHAYSHPSSAGWLNE